MSKKFDLSNYRIGGYRGEFTLNENKEISIVITHVDMDSSALWDYGMGDPEELDEPKYIKEGESHIYKLAEPRKEVLAPDDEGYYHISIPEWDIDDAIIIITPEGALELIEEE